MEMIGNVMDTAWKQHGNGLGMEMECKQNEKRIGMQLKWSGNGMETEWKWNVIGMEMET